MTDPLQPYHRKRDFALTPEPVGGELASDAAVTGGRFVVQRHRASRLHYDLRLEVDNVLVSWAVPKGPTLDPNRKRLAIATEDHPLEYLLFEGVIPPGQYGAGDVIVWDTGNWAPAAQADPAAALRDGELHFDVWGRKLRGRFVLTRSQKADATGQDTWLLLHKDDEFAEPGWNPEAHPWSVLSGRDNDAVAAAPASTEVLRHHHHIEPPPLALPSAAVAPLYELGNQGTWEIFGRSLQVTNLDKVMFAADPPITKREFLAYSARIAPVVVPYVQGRALNMHRYPDGVGKKGFWHKNLPNSAPEWLSRWREPSSEADTTSHPTYLVVDEPAALVWAANYGVVEWHPWTSPISAPQLPTYALIDLDPGEATTWDDLLALARLHQSALEHLGVVGQPKVSGKRGLHIWIPVAGDTTFDQTRAWVEKLSRTVGQVMPDKVSWRWRVSERQGRARLDYTQNAVSKTLVGPYSPRAVTEATVSVPITWEELADPDLRPDRWSIRTVLERLDERGDPFWTITQLHQELPPIS